MPLLDPEQRKQLKVASRVGAVGLEMALSVVLGYFAGRWCDGRFDTEPYLMYLGVLAGIIAGFRSLYRVARSINLDEM